MWILKKKIFLNCRTWSAIWVVNGPAKRRSVDSSTAEHRHKSNLVQWLWSMIQRRSAVFSSTLAHRITGSLVRPNTNARGMESGAPRLPHANVSLFDISKDLKDPCLTTQALSFNSAVITCDDPEVPTGSYVVGYDLNVHSLIEYTCETGYLLHGEPHRTCGNDGEWTGEVPSCECE